jgi:hypothetical protein
MISIVIIGKTEEKATAIAKWIAGETLVDGKYSKKVKIDNKDIDIIAETVWPGCTKIKPRSDVVFYDCSEANDLIGITDLTKHYMNVPVKFVVYSGVDPQADHEKELGAAGFKKGDPQAMIDKLQKAHDELEKVMKQVFDDFDKDKSGFIDLPELLEIAGKLGVSLSATEAVILYKEVDLNKDGKISFEEFANWWRSGRHGKTFMLSDIIMKEIKGNPVLNTAAAILSEFGGIADLKEEEKKFVKHSYEFHLNKVIKEGGVAMHTTLMSCGKELDSHIQEYRTCLPFGPNTTFIALSLGCKDKANELKDKLKVCAEKIFTTLKDASHDPKEVPFTEKLRIETGALDKNRAVLAFTPKPGQHYIPKDKVRDFAGFINAFSKDQTFDFFAQLGFDIKKFCTEGQSLAKVLLEDGARFIIKTQTLQQFADKVFTFKSQGKEVPANIKEKLSAAEKGPLLVVNEEELAKLVEKPVMDKLSIQCNMLSQMLAPPEELIPMPIQKDVQDIFKEKVENLEIFLSIEGRIAFKIHLELPGLSEYLAMP